MITVYAWRWNFPGRAQKLENKCHAKSAKRENSSCCSVDDCYKGLINTFTLFVSKLISDKIRQRTTDKTVNFSVELLLQSASSRLRRSKSSYPCKKQRSGNQSALEHCSNWRRGSPFFS